MEWLTLLHRLRPAGSASVAEGSTAGAGNRGSEAASPATGAAIPGSPANSLSSPTDSTSRLGVGRKCAVQMPLFMMNVPRLPWFSSTAEACHANTVISDFCTVPWFWVTAEACRQNAVIASNRAIIYRIGILCRGQP